MRVSKQPRRIARVGVTHAQPDTFVLTDETHPLHIHLVEFQVLNRQHADSGGYKGGVYAAAFPGGTFFGIEPDGSAGLVDYPAGTFIPGYGPPNDYLTPNADGAIGGNPAFSPFLQGSTIPPEIYERGWKDVFHIENDHVNRAVVRFSPTDTPVGAVKAGQNQYTFDPTRRPGLHVPLPHVRARRQRAHAHVHLESVSGSADSRGAQEQRQCHPMLALLPPRFMHKEDRPRADDGRPLGTRTLSLRTVVPYCLAVLTIAPCIIHFAGARQHFQEYWLLGVVTLVAGGPRTIGPPASRCCRRGHCAS